MQTEMPRRRRPRTRAPLDCVAKNKLKNQRRVVEQPNRMAPPIAPKIEDEPAHDVQERCSGCMTMRTTKKLHRCPCCWE